MSKPEKAITSPAESEFSEARLEQAGQASQELMEIKAGFSEDQRRVTQLIGERIGRKQMTNAFQKICNITDLVDLQRIKETKGYKGYQIIVDGKSVIITTFEEYCTHVEGRSYESVNLELSNFKQLGEEFFDAMRQIGIGPATMRDYRKLPDDEKQALLEVAQTGDKDSFVELASSLITKHQREKETTEKQLSELTKQLTANDAVIQKKDQKLNELDHELEQLKLDQPVFAHVNWPDAFKGYVEQVAITRRNLKHAIGSLDVLRESAMQLEPQSAEEEASLTRAKEILATELVGIHNECLDMVEALGLSFDRSLGAYSEARIRLLQG